MFLIKKLNLPSVTFVFGWHVLRISFTVDFICASDSYNRIKQYLDTLKVITITILIFQLITNKYVSKFKTFIYYISQETENFQLYHKNWAFIILSSTKQITDIWNRDSD